MTITPEKRDAIAAKIRALRAKTVDNGCTEAEAMAAIGMIETLMDRYRFEKSDLDQGEPEEKYGKGTRSGYGVRHAKATKWHPTVGTWGLLAKMCGVKIWMSPLEATVHAFGAEQDVLSLWYYMDLVRTASETAWANATHLSGYSQKVAFMAGFCQGVNGKIREIMESRTKADAAANAERGLMRISRDAVMQSKYRIFAASEGLRLRSTSHGGGNGNQYGRDAGRAAGSSVNLGGARSSIGGAAKRLNN
jgi:hypothetical protein